MAARLDDGTQATADRGLEPGQGCAARIVLSIPRIHLKCDRFQVVHHEGVERVGRTAPTAQGFSIKVDGVGGARRGVVADVGHSNGK